MYPLIWKVKKWTGSLLLLSPLHLYSLNYSVIKQHNSVEKNLLFWYNCRIIKD